MGSSARSLRAAALALACVAILASCSGSHKKILDPTLRIAVDTTEIAGISFLEYHISRVDVHIAPVDELGGGAG